MVNRYEVVGIALMAAAVAFAAPARAEGRTVRVVLAPATVSGLPQAPTAHEFYRTALPRVSVRPTAGVYHMLDGAPPNGCPGFAFRVMSGSKSERGCYGR